MFLTDFCTARPSRLGPNIIKDAISDSDSFDWLAFGDAFSGRPPNSRMMAFAAPWISFTRVLMAANN